MGLDRKFLLIASCGILLLIFGGVFYAATRLQIITLGSESLQRRSDFIAAVERGEKTISAPQAVGLIRLSLDAEMKRTAAIVATRQLLTLLATFGVLCCAVLAWSIRRVTRELPMKSRVLF